MRVMLVDPGCQVPHYDAALAGALAAGGHAVRLATAPLLAYDPPTMSDGVVPGPSFGRQVARAPSLARRRTARRLLRAAGYPSEWRALAAGMNTGDVVHLQWSLAPPIEARALRALAARGVAGVVTVHNVLPHEPRPWHRPLLARLYQAAGALIVHSEAARVRLLAVAPGVVPDAVHVIPMATLPLPTTTADRAAARARLGLPADMPLALFFGHIRPYKGLPALLRAWPDVARALPGAQLVVAGAVAGGSGARARVGDACLAVGALPRLGSVPAADAGDLFVAADVVVLPYASGDDSAVLQAARGHGRAVVATRVGGLAEALALGGGRTVPPGDDAALVDALVALLGDPAARDALEAAARAAATVWTWSDVAERTVAVYQAALARGGVMPRHAAGDGDGPLDGGNHPARAGAMISPRNAVGEARGAVPSPSADVARPVDRPLPADDAHPEVSVIVPAKDAGRDLPATLAALLAGDYPADQLEVVIAVAPSADDTRARVAALAAGAGRRSDGRPRVRVVDNPAGGTSAGLNAALVASSGHVIVRLDAHAVPAADYVSASVAALAATGAWAVGGPMASVGATPFGAAVARAHATWLGSGGAAYRRAAQAAPRPVDTVYLGAWPRGVLQRLGGFEETLARNQDYELCLRIREAGGAVWLDPAIRTATRTRDTPLALWRQYLGYGAGRAATWRRHPRSLRFRQAAPAAFVAMLAVAATVAAVGRGRGPDDGSEARGSACGASSAWPRHRRRGRRSATGRSERVERGAVAVKPGGSPTALLATLAGPYALVVGAVALRRGGGTAGDAARFAAALVIMHVAWGVGFWWGVAKAPRAGRRR